MATDLPTEPESRKEQYLAKIAGQNGTLPDRPKSREEQYLAYIAENGGGGGGGGTTNYNALENKPKINDVELVGDKTTADLYLNYEELDNRPRLESYAIEGDIYNEATTVFNIEFDTSQKVFTIKPARGTATAEGVNDSAGIFGIDPDPNGSGTNGGFAFDLQTDGEINVVVFNSDGTEKRAMTYTADKLYTKTETDDLLSSRQDALTAGYGIELNDSTGVIKADNQIPKIFSTGNGDGYFMNNADFAFHYTPNDDNTVTIETSQNFDDDTYIDVVKILPTVEKLAEYQKELTPGQGIDITNDVISADFATDAEIEAIVTNVFGA